MKTEQGKHNPNKLRRGLCMALGGVLLLGAAGYVGAGWQLSSKALAVTHQQVEYDQTIVSANGDSFTIKGGAYDVDGLMGGIRPDGSTMGIFSKPSSLDGQAQTSKRTLRDGHGQLPQAHQQLSLQGNIWTSNPKEALGLDYSEVQYQGQLGPMNAWMVPAKDSKAWTVAVHGIGAPRSELLRFIKPVHDAGNNVLAINYRNDAGNPASPDGFNHLGDTEWQDLQSAVHYAKEHGAAAINLYGVSLGGSVVEKYLRQVSKEEAASIGKVVLDSPVLDWEDTLRHRVEAGGYPGFLTEPGMRVASWRAGIDFDALSTPPGTIHHKTLIFHNSEDHSVPSGPSVKVAEAQPDLVTLYDFRHGGHARSWNYDPDRYNHIVTDYLH